MSSDPLIGKQLSNFQLERLLGKGGMGQVYYAHDVKLNRPVAVKVIASGLRDDPSYAKRFVNEAQTVATWRHENIAQVYYADEQDDLYYFAMEYIDGADLGEVLLGYTSKDELMSQDEVLRIGRAIASALDYAHARDVIHRDVKPSNVLIAQDGRVVLTDFGLALDTQQGSVGEVSGTAHYIAPEQARRSSEAVPQSDLYSLGVVLYEMLTGVVPFDDPSPTSLALQHIMEPPPAPRSRNPNLNRATEWVLLKALEKSPQDRYQTGELLMDALEHAIQEGETSLVPALPPLPPVGIQTQPPVPKAAIPRTLPSFRTVRNKGIFPWVVLGGCSLALVISLVAAVVFVAAPLMGLWQAGPLSLKASVSATPVSPTITREPTQESVPDKKQTSTPSSAEAPTVQPSTTPEVGTPTVQYPNGKRFMLFYDNNSLFFLNLSESDLPINWVAFERLDDSGAASNRFNGSRWGQFYGTSTPGWCMAIEILDSGPYLNPEDCGHSNKYLSLRTPTRDDATVFWTTQEGSHQFRVLWREGGTDEEVARCEISAGTCEVFLP